MTAYHRPTSLFRVAPARSVMGVFCMVPAAKAERPVSVQLADPRGNARQGGRCAASGHLRDDEAPPKWTQRRLDGSRAWLTNRAHLDGDGPVVKSKVRDQV